MGPLFNPIYWFLGLIFLAVAVFGAIASGFVACVVGLLLARKLKKRALRISLPVAIAIPTMLVVFFLAFCSLCHWSLSDPNAPRRKPNREDIVGVWSLTPWSLQLMEEEGGYEVSTHTLTFRQDGMFVMTNMPDWWLNSFGESRGEFHSGYGTWEIDKDVGGRWAIEVHFTSLTGYWDNLVTFFNLSGREPPYRIYVFLGDPDSARVMVFER